MDQKPYIFFPGCSLASAGHENTSSLQTFCQQMGIGLEELDDWNCCGSSSAHSINRKAAEQLAFRNLSLVPEGLPLLVACPSCLLRLKQAHTALKAKPDLQNAYLNSLGKPFDPNLEILSFFELFSRIRLRDYFDDPRQMLRGLKVAPYYGCMLAVPPDLKGTPSHTGIMEDALARLGADIVYYGRENRCCGTYLSVVKPGIVEEVIADIMGEAVSAGAECMVTACAMCHLNLEIRCPSKTAIPTFHFSELLSLALGAQNLHSGFKKHMIDPFPLLKARELYPQKEKTEPLKPCQS